MDGQNVFLTGPIQLASVTTGGGVFMLMDLAETERNEAKLFVDSLKTRWMDVWSDVTGLQQHLKQLELRWNLFETVGTQKAYICIFCNELRNHLLETIINFFSYGYLRICGSTGFMDTTIKFLR